MPSCKVLGEGAGWRQGRWSKIVSSKLCHQGKELEYHPFSKVMVWTLFGCDYQPTRVGTTLFHRGHGAGVTAVLLDMEAETEKLGGEIFLAFRDCTKRREFEEEARLSRCITRGHQPSPQGAMAFSQHL